MPNGLILTLQVLITAENGQSAPEPHTDCIEGVVSGTLAIVCRCLDGLATDPGRLVCLQSVHDALDLLNIALELHLLEEVESLYFQRVLREVLLARPRLIPHALIETAAAGHTRLGGRAVHAALVGLLQVAILVA